MPQAEGVDASVVLGCGQWYLAHNTAQRRLLENSATPSQAGLQKKVSRNTPVLVIFFGRPIYTNVTKLNYFWHSFFVRDITGFTKLYWQWTDFFYCLPRTYFDSLRKETNALGDVDDSGCTFATGYILYTGCFQTHRYYSNSRRRLLQIRQTSCIVSCFISTWLWISGVKSNFIFKKVYPTNHKMGWPNALGRRSSWSETSWSDSVLAVASSQTMLSAKLPKSLSLGRCIRFCRCKYCCSSSRNASALFDSTNSKLRSWKKK